MGGGLTSGPAWRTWERSWETEVQELEERVRQLGSSGTGGEVAAHFAHSWRPWGLDELEPMAEACQLGGGWAARRCFDLWAAVFCRGRCAQRIGFKVHESQLLATNSRFLTSLGNSARRDRAPHCMGTVVASAWACSQGLKQRQTSSFQPT